MVPRLLPARLDCSGCLLVRCTELVLSIPFYLEYPMHDIWGPLAQRVASERYLFPGEDWPKLAHRVSSNVFGAVADRGDVSKFIADAERFITARQFIPGGRYLYATGRTMHQTQNCLLFKADDSREGWADHYYKHVMGLSTGAGIGTVYSWIRPKGTPLQRTGGVAGGPVNLVLGTNEVGRTIRTGGDRRAALWAGLHWWHEDVMEFITAKNWSPEIRAAKAADWNAVAPMDMTNHSVCLDDAFFEAMSGGTASIMDVRIAARGKLNVKQDPRSAAEVAQAVYWAVINNMLRTGDPGFSIDVGVNAGECLRNACTEVSSYDDSDVCNIASANMARFKTLPEYVGAVRTGTAFLVAGSVYSHLPYARVDEVRTKNRRLGLGNMGVHEWLMQRGKSYGPDDELGAWLAEYAKSTEIAAQICESWGLSHPVKTRAMAPNGTIGLCAETTTSMEPLLCVALKRRVKQGDQTWAQYVVDPVAQRLIESGIKPSAIETAYSLAESLAGIERRVQFQAWFQQFVDHGISSTINMAHWGHASNNESTVQRFGEMLLKYLPKLRGITVYPDGARGGQPITQVSYETALKHAGQIVYEQGDVCDMRGGNCG